MTTWHDRLNKALTEANMTPAELARAVGASTASVSEWLGGITKELKASNSERVCTVLRINHRWLITGKGAMRPGENAGIAQTTAHYHHPISPKLASLINSLDQDHLAKLEEIAELYARKETAQ